MVSLNCKFEKVSHFGIGMALLVIGFIFSVVGITVLPVIGLVVAVPAFVASFLFFKAHRSKECQLEFEKERE